jgi:hypothetical protein
MSARHTLAQAFALLSLAGCGPEAPATDAGGRDSATTTTDLCGGFDSLAGHRVTIHPPLDLAVVVWGEPGTVTFCAAPPACPACDRWWLAIECADRFIAFAPGHVVGLTETEPGNTGNFFCTGPADGTPQGGATCEPHDCGGRLRAYDLTHLSSLTGVLQSTPRTDLAIDGRPVYLFGMEEMEIRPFDPAQDCDPTIPRAGCPCEGYQTLCPGSLECGGSFGPPGVWTSVPDACGIG